MQERQLSGGRRTIAAFNCSDREQQLSLPQGSWQLVLSTDDEKYGGRVDVAAHATAAVGTTSRHNGSRRSGDEWKMDDPGPRTEDQRPAVPPWTALVLTSEGR